MLDKQRWQVVTPSQFSWEQEALDFLRAKCELPWAMRGWSNFEFVDPQGKFYEVDLLLLTLRGLVLVEIKSYPGLVGIDDMTLVRKGHKNAPTIVENNPLRGANHKCKVLKGVLQRQAALRDRKHLLPYIQAMVFMSSPDVELTFREGTSQAIYTRLDVVAPLKALHPGSAPLDPFQEELVCKAMSQAGISSQKRRTLQVNDWVLGPLLGEGPDYQDHLATHQSLDTMHRRVRTFSCSQTEEADRKRARNAAQREFRMLELIEHEGIIKPLEYKEHDLGPALLYRYEDQAIRLDHFLQRSERSRQLDLPTRLRMLRQLAEVIRYAHARHLIHRALAPQNILVTQVEKPQPLLKVMNWHTGLSQEETTGTIHLSALVADEMTAYMAPETFIAPQLADAACDVFSLGCVGYFLLSGQPPAADQLTLTQKLGGPGGLSLALAMDGVSPELEALISRATEADVSHRPESVEQFLLDLDKVEATLKLEPEEEATTDPFSAAPKDRITGPWLLVRKLGQGAVSGAFLVRNEESDEQLVLKLPANPDHNDKLDNEAEALEQLDHPKIVKLKGRTWVGQRRALFLSHAGDSSLADRLAREGPLGLEFLQRFGDDLLEMLEYLEDKGFSHRDLKPANLGVRGLGKNEVQHLVLFDFSLARESATSLRVGTPGYRDPFLKAPRNWDSAAERYSAGATLYEMATATLPQWGDGRSDPALVVTAELQLDGDRFESGLREGFLKFFSKALHRDSKQRFDDAESMRAAWNKIFRAAAQAAQTAAPLLLPEFLSGRTNLGETTQEPKLLQAFDRLQVQTVEDFIRLPRTRFRLLSGLGSQTRRQLLEHQLLLESKLEAPAAAPISAQEGLDALVESLMPAENWEKQFTLRYLGLLSLKGEAESEPALLWPSGPEVALAIGKSASEAYKLLPRLRKRWDKNETLTKVRDELVEALQKLGGVASPAELGEMLLTARGSLSNHGPTRSRQAQAVLRAAQDVEYMQELPRLDAFRQGAKTVLAEAPELYSNLGALAKSADERIEQEPPPSRESLAGVLRLSLAGAAAERWSEIRLLQLAENYSQKLCLSSRGEPYPRGLAAARALQLGSALLVGRPRLRPSEIGELIRSRFPQAQALPTGQAELEQLLGDCSLDLVWDRKEDSFRPRSSSLVTTPTRNRTSGHETLRGPRDQVERHLSERFRDGGALVLTVPGRLLERAQERLCGLLPLHAVSMEERLLAHLHRAAADQEIDWSVVVGADADGPGGALWGNLQSLVDLAVESLEKELRGAGQGLLLTRLGLLARYGRLKLLERLMATADAGEMSSLWLLVTQGAEDWPRVDEQVLPLPAAGKAVALSRSWLEEAAAAEPLAKVLT